MGGEDQGQSKSYVGQQAAPIAGSSASVNQQRIFEEIRRERRYQDDRWGTAFDDRNTLNDWLQYIANYGAKAAGMENRGNPGVQRQMMVKVAALAVAALETFDRNAGFAPRHYEYGG